MSAIPGFFMRAGGFVLLRRATDPDISSDDNSSFLVTGILFYDSDGGVRISQETGGAGAVITDVTPWSTRHPNETEGADWSVRVRFISGDNVYTSGDALNTWHVLSSNRSFTFSRSDTGPSSESGVFDVSISDDGGSTVWDGPNQFTVTLTNNAP